MQLVQTHRELVTTAVTRVSGGARKMYSSHKKGSKPVMVEKRKHIDSKQKYRCAEECCLLESAIFLPQRSSSDTRLNTAN